MSIHNFKDVEEGETHDSHLGTRDRFGKTHRLSNEDGTPRLPGRPAGTRRKRKLAALAVIAFWPVLGASFAWADAQPEQWGTANRRNTDIRVETEGLDANSWLNQKFNDSEDRFGIPMNESTALEINENGDPNLSTRF